MANGIATQCAYAAILAGSSMEALRPYGVPS